MTTTTPSSDGTSPRMAAFQEEVRRLGATGGAAGPERRGSIIGVLFIVAGVLLGVAAYNSGSSNVAPDGDAVAQLRGILDSTNATLVATLAVGLIVIGAVVWLRNSLTRYLRHWLLRLVYEQREQVDRLVEAHRDDTTRLIDALRDGSRAPADHG